jgi:glutamine synthetase
MLYCDLAGVIRGIACHVDVLESRMVAGAGLPVNMLTCNVLDQAATVPGIGPSGELRLMPDADTFVVLPYAARSGAMLSDLTTPDGAPSELCPRGFLKRMVRRSIDNGLQIKAAFEQEWSLGVRSDDRFVPFDETLALSSVGMQTPVAIVDEIVDALGKQSLRVEHYHPETGGGQQEITLRHAPALRAADNQMLLRDTIRSVVYKHGFFASFAPKPWTDQPGNGCHIHMSVWDAGGDDNLFYDRASPQRLSRLGRQFVAGILDHLPGLVGITCPTYNSYRRLQPGQSACAYRCAGPDNREAAIRLVSPTMGAEQSSMRIELRAVDGATNPYLAMGAVIAAGLDGVTRGLELSDDLILSEDPHSLDPEERERRGIARLPESLREAIDELERDELLNWSLGHRLTEVYTAVRRSEWSAFDAQGLSFEHKQHYWKY